MERAGVVTPRIADVAVLAAAAIGGLLFAPVFGPAALLLPIGAVVLVTYGVTELGRRFPKTVPWRPVFAVVAGLLAVIETVLPGTTAAGIPTGETLAVLAAGAVDGWQLTLRTTWPARPEPELISFVPLAVLAAAVLGIELLHRLRRPLIALVPGLLVLVLSQAYVAVTGAAAVATGIGYAVIAGLLLVSGGGTALPRLLKLVAPAVVLGVVCALALAVADPLARPAYSLKDDESVPLAEVSVASPLSEIAYRTRNPSPQVFRYTGDAPASRRWPLAVLDEFDGSNWLPGGGFRRLGAEIPPRTGEVPAARRQATIEMTAPSGPWLPGQTSPASVTGIDALVDETRGTLVATEPSSRRYTLGWWEPQVGPEDLMGAGTDPALPGGLGGLGTVPPEIGELADRALPPELRPSFQTAVALERYLAGNYRLATGDDLPTGHGWPQLRRFLVEGDKRGTSEQFAAAYVVLARLKGIPARLVVGYRAPDRAEADGAHVVRNSDIIAWPEVAVAKVGWVPLDPSGAAEQSGSAAAGGIAAAVAEVRTQLPPVQKMENPPLPPGESEEDTGSGMGNWRTPAIIAAVGLVVLVMLWGAGVPGVTAFRAWRRRRKVGREAVIGAWAEARDRLRAHGLRVTAGMTVRDLAATAGVFGDQSTVEGLRSLARSVDAALWSGTAPDVAHEAWVAVKTVRKGLGRRSWTARLRAAVNIRVLFPPRAA